MKCKYCGAEIDDDSKFCGYCGKEQPHVKLCIKCGKELEVEDKWCRFCGAEQSKLNVAESFAVPNIKRPSDEKQNINEDYQDEDEGKNQFGKKSLFAIVITILIGIIGGVALGRIGIIGDVFPDNKIDTTSQIDTAEFVEPIVKESLSPEDDAKHFVEKFIKMVVEDNNKYICRGGYEKCDKHILVYCSKGLKSLWAREKKLCKASDNGYLIEDEETCGPGYGGGDCAIRDLNYYVLHGGDNIAMCGTLMDFIITDYSIKSIGMLDGDRRAICNIELWKQSCSQEEELHDYVSKIELIKEDGKWAVDEINGFRGTESRIKETEDYHYRHGGKKL